MKLALFHTCILMLATALVVTEAAGSSWSYKGATGPSHWSQKYPDCKLQSQSPINLSKSNSKYQGGFMYFASNYHTIMPLSIIHNGHSLQANILQTKARVYTNGMGVFQPEQFHFHWGSHVAQGSEHTIENKRAPLELHIVHFNTKYGSFSNAMDKPDGLLVMGVMFKAVSQGDNYMDNILRVIMKRDYVSDPSTAKQLSKIDNLSVNVGRLLPPFGSRFYRYKGSLTTPPCYQSVDWFVFPDGPAISSNVLKELRLAGAHPIQDNFRPLQHINGRKIIRSFQ